MAHSIIRTPADLEAYVTLLRTLKLPFTAQHKQGADRSLDQNALQWKWAVEASVQRGDMQPDEIQREWKLRYGVPILREESEDFCRIYDENIRPRSYEDKIELMRIIDVTSIMTVKQMTRFLDRVQRECAEQGIRLTDPEDKQRVG
jgi:hypothetical protein